MPAGRPSKYDPAYCEQAIDYLSKGHSVEALAGYLSVSLTTLERWEKAHDEFRGAIKEGRLKAIHFWEERLMECAKENKGNVTAIIFGLKNRAASVWRDRVEVSKEETHRYVLEVTNPTGNGHDITPDEWQQQHSKTIQ